MCIRLVLLAVLALMPWQASAIEVSPASISPSAICQVEPEPIQEAHDRARAVCVWSVAGEAGPETPDAEGLSADGSGWPGSGWRYKSGATLFVVGNVITFSFPIWAVVGADAITITGVIIAGELIELVGIFLLGEEALRAIRERLGDAVDHLRTEFRRWRASASESWMPISLERWY